MPERLRSDNGSPFASTASATSTTKCVRTKCWASGPLRSSSRARSGNTPERVPDPEYPLYWERRRECRDGSLKFQGRQPYLSEALAGDVVGSVEVEEDLWQIWFCGYKVAVLDSAQAKLWGVGSAGRRPATIQAALEAAKP